MCGIAGIISSQRTSSFELNVESMLDLIQHRGPDGRGIQSSSYGTLGHVRLSILDGSAAATQPYIDTDYILSYNGEIYNYQELKHQLPPIKYQSYSDTEVLFHALKTWGVDKTLAKCRGMFAFCWHNRNTGETVLVRDRFGIKPLFYALNNHGNLVFASEIKSVLPYTNGVLNHFRFIMSPLGGLERDGIQTAWDHVVQVPPGHKLVFKNGTAILSRYFDLMDYFNIDQYHECLHLSDLKLCTKLDELLSQAVSDMGMGDIPAGSFMSGGVDSGLISYYGKSSNPNIQLFTSDVFGKLSELHLAQLNAKTLNSDLITSTYLDDHCVDYLVDVTWHYESPLVVHFNALPLSELALTARNNGVKAVLTGEGADELFVGYPHLIGSYISRLADLPHTLLNRLYGSVSLLKRLRSKKEFGIDFFNVLRDTAEGDFLNDGLILAKDKWQFMNEPHQRQHLLSVKMIKSHLLSLLWRNDRMGMMHSIESRFPFLDERLVSFAINLPYKYKVATVSRFGSIKHPFKSGKHLLRKVASNYLPDGISYGQKTGFPVNGLMRLHIQNDFFDNGTLQRVLQLNRSGMSRFLNEMDPYFKSLLCMTEIWSRLFVEGQSKDSLRMDVARSLRVGG